MASFQTHVAYLLRAFKDTCVQDIVENYASSLNEDTYMTMVRACEHKVLKFYNIAKNDMTKEPVVENHVYPESRSMIYMTWIQTNIRQLDKIKKLNDEIVALEEELKQINGHLLYYPKNIENLRRSLTEFRKLNDYVEQLRSSEWALDSLARIYASALYSNIPSTHAMYGHLNRVVGPRGEMLHIPEGLCVHVVTKCISEIEKRGNAIYVDMIARRRLFTREGTSSKE